MTDITASQSTSAITAAQMNAVKAAQENAIRPLNASDIQKSANEKKIDKALQDYEGVFLGQMLSHMTETVDVDPAFGGGQGEKTMRSLLINEYGRMMAANGGVGLAAAMKKQLIAAQENTQAPANAAIKPAGE